MNHSDKIFDQPRWLTVSLWFESRPGEKDYRYPVMLTSKGHRPTMFMLLNCLTLIPDTRTDHLPTRPPYAQNPIAQLDDQHRLPIPAVSSLGASPTPAQ